MTVTTIDSSRAATWPRFPVAVYPVYDWPTDRWLWKKRPLVHWREEATCDPQQWREWQARWAYLGERLGQGMPTGHTTAFVIDSDPRNGGTEEAVAQLDLPPTLTASTISDGRHRFFTYDRPLRCGVLQSGVDFKANGGLAVIDPTKGYKWLNPETPIARLPQWIADKFRQHTHPKPRVGGPVPQPEPLPGAFDTCVWTFMDDSLREAPVVGRRSSRTFWFLRRCRELQLRDGQIVTAVRQFPPAVHKDSEQAGWLNADLDRFFGGR